MTIDFYSIDEIRQKIASNEYSAELLLQHAMHHIDRLTSEAVKPIPQAWLWQFSDGDWHEIPFGTIDECENECAGYDGKAHPLYLAPPPPAEVPLLTDVELRDALRSCPTDAIEPLRTRWLYAKDFARAIESVVRQKVGLK